MADKDFIVKNGLVVNNFLSVNTTTIYIGNTLSNATVNTTVYTGTSNNTLYVGVTAVADVINTTSLSIALTPYARLDQEAAHTANIKVSTASLILDSSALYAGGTRGTLNQALMSTGSGVKWSSIDSVSMVAPGSCNQIIMNKSGSYSGASGLKYDDTSNTLSIGNTSIVATVNSTIYSGTANNSNNLGGHEPADYLLKSELNDYNSTATSFNALNLGGIPAANYISTSGEKTITSQWTFNSIKIHANSGDWYLYANDTAGYWSGYAGDVQYVAGRPASSIVDSNQLASSLSYAAPKDTWWTGVQYSFVNRNIRQSAGLFYSNNSTALVGESWKEHGVYGICHNELHDVNDLNDPNTYNTNRWGCGVVGHVQSNSTNSIGVYGISNNGIGAQGDSRNSHGVVAKSWGNNTFFALVADANPRASDGSGGNSNEYSAGGVFAISKTNTALAGTSNTGYLIDTWKEGYYSTNYHRVYNNGSLHQSGGLYIDGIDDISFNFISSSERRVRWNFNDWGSVYFYGRSSDKVLGLYDSNGDYDRWSTDHDGNFVARGNVGAYSDIKLKKDVTTIDNALDKVSKMRGVMFTRKDNDQKGTGVIAQEIQEVLPEVVSADSEGTLNVAYGNIVGVLIEAIKELKAEIEQLKGK